MIISLDHRTQLTAFALDARRLRASTSPTAAPTASWLHETPGSSFSGPPFCGARSTPLLLLSSEEAARIKPPSAPLRDRWPSGKGPWSVTFHRPGALSKAGPHDFFCEGPYWWPDPKNPNGPYIRTRRRGQPRPLRRQRPRLSATWAKPSSPSALAAYYLKGQAAAARAWQLLETWFLDPATLHGPEPRIRPGHSRSHRRPRHRHHRHAPAHLVRARRRPPERRLPRSARTKPVRAWFAKYVDLAHHEQKGHRRARQRQQPLHVVGRTGRRLRPPLRRRRRRASPPTALPRAVHPQTIQARRFRARRGSPHQEPQLLHHEPRRLRPALPRRRALAASTSGRSLDTARSST